MGSFVFQVVLAYGTGAPLLIFLYLYWTGDLPTYPENSILPTSYIFIPVMVLIARQVVIAVKYAFIPRRRMRVERVKTRREDEMNDDLLGTWMGTPRNESLAHQLDLALWRAGLAGDDEEEYITFASPVSSEVFSAINLPEITPPKPPKTTAKAKNEDGASNGMVHKNFENDTKLDIEGSSGTVSSKKPQEEYVRITNKISLRTLVKYATFTGTTGVPAPFSIVLVGMIVLAVLPLFYLGLNGQPLFGNPSNPLEQYVCAVGWINCFMSLPSNLLMFPLAPFVIFKRSRYRLDQYFELLIPSTIIDVRSKPYNFASPFNGLVN